MQTHPARLLIRCPSPVKRIASFGAAGNRFSISNPLFKAQNGTPWHAAETRGQATISELWDAAYEAQATAKAQTVEPDALQPWATPTSARQKKMLAGSADHDRGVVDPQNPDFPRGPGFAWHLGPNFSDLESARAAVANPQTTRVAIFDVGFDFSHRTRPDNLLLSLQKNFVDDGRTDASDPDISGIMENPGHGTATIAILAGGKLTNMKLPTPSGGDYLGGAPHAEVVPIRIAQSVVLLKTSAFAEAMEYVLSLQNDPATAVDIVSMSMGGVGSDAWADMVNRAYEAGIFIVTAAGNNYGRPKSIVYPARFSRVLAACGVMADFKPYDLGFGAMSGNYGPDSKMDTAIAAFTPNIPWAEIGSPDIVDWDGQGTSAATPQVAAAAALWLQKYKDQINGWAGWQKVEIIRQALFNSAGMPNNIPNFRKYFGRGILKANAALAQAPSTQNLVKLPLDTAAFSFFQVLRGSIFAATATPTPTDRMFDLELTQLLHRDGNVEATMEDPATPSPTELRKFVDAVIASPCASTTLKNALKQRVKLPPGGNGTPNVGANEEDVGHTGNGDGDGRPWVWKEEQSSSPLKRQLRVFALDPAARHSLESADICEATIPIDWEPLEPGPTGEYVEVVDHDTASGCFYAPVDLEDRYILATDGLPPMEGNPKFHQQMVYAVAMRTIETFEHALGRIALWSPRGEGEHESEYVQRLRIYPHALRDQNAYYTPEKKALLFGYFPAHPATLESEYPGGMVFACLSHDIVAHETAHALLDGMARGLVRATNRDMLAFHEAFADIVALFQHFSLPGLVQDQLAHIKGDLRANNFLDELAKQFGEATGQSRALRSYIGNVPDPAAYENETEPHARGAILVAAVFDAFVALYERRTAVLRQIAAGYTGQLHPDLVKLLANEASQAAEHILKMCIRAIDYCPPVDLNFGDFLRALITADFDVFPEDPLDYRVAVIEAFRKHNIYPRDVRTLSEDSLVWRGPREELLQGPKPEWMSRLQIIAPIVRRLSRAAASVDWPPYELKYLRLEGPNPRFGKAGNKIPSREALFRLLTHERKCAQELWKTLLSNLSEESQDRIAQEFGLTFVDAQGKRDRQFEVYSLSIADREDNDGLARKDIIIGIRQQRTLTIAGRDQSCEGGCTIIVDADKGCIRYIVSKRIDSTRRQETIANFRAEGSGLNLTYFNQTPFTGPGGRFAMVHALMEETSHV